jgi:UDP-2,3-diacylglucosamine hydrolase
MRLWVFSDLHLNEPTSEFYQSFLSVLDQPQDENDVVVFAGDIFDLMVGTSQYFAEKHAFFFKKVKTLANKRVQLYYIEGNHDFHIQNQFDGVPIQFENEAVQLKVQTASGIKLIYIAHGDLVDQSDRGYLGLRKFFRSRLVQIAASQVPGQWIEKLGQAFSRPHRQKDDDLVERWPPSKRDVLRAIFRDFARQKKAEGFDYVILGHCHDLDQIEPFYYNMGFPPVHRQFVSYDSSDDCVKRKSL